MKNGKYCILIADDEKEIRDILRLLLEGEGYAVLTAEDGREAIAEAAAEVDLYILDVNMPEVSGFPAAAEIRKHFDAPIVFLTAYSTESDKVMGFSVGADDYIVKPFSNMELLMRVKAILRRSSGVKAPVVTEKIPFADLILDTESRSVSRQGEMIPLTYTEFQILELLVTHKKKISIKASGERMPLATVRLWCISKISARSWGMIPGTRNISRRRGDGGIMLTNENGRKTKRLSREILGLLLITAVIALFFWGFLYLTANSISETYFTERNLQPSEGQWLTLRAWIRSVSLLSTVILFLVLFLFLLGQKLAYLREIIQGVDALRTHRLEDTIPLREANELTELAEHINFLSETERRLRQQEMALQAERERMIRDLSHDIRTPLTAILSYSDYMSRKDGYTDAELREYFSLVRKKAAQMKDMTDRLLEGSKRNVEPVENGRLLMEQLAGEWEEILEDSFSCEISMEKCTDFRAEWDMQEIDNLSSNVEKYADSGHPVLLQMDRGVDTLRILQKNAVRQTAQKIESNQIGLESIRRITAGYGGAVTVSLDEKQFQIEITLPVSEKWQQESEEWLMALGLLLILFMVMSIISVVGLLLLFLLKGERAQKIVFYFMALLGMFIAWMTATGYATNQIKEQMISWGFGALAVVAVLVRLCGKSKNAALAAKLLAAASVVLGMVALFIG